MSTETVLVGDSQFQNIWQTGLNCKCLKDNLRWSTKKWEHVGGILGRCYLCSSASSVVQMCAWYHRIGQNCKNAKVLKVDVWTTKYICFSLSEICDGTIQRKAAQCEICIWRCAIWRRAAVFKAGEICREATCADNRAVCKYSTTHLLVQASWDWYQAFMRACEQWKQLAFEAVGLRSCYQLSWIPVTVTPSFLH